MKDDGNCDGLGFPNYKGIPKPNNSVSKKLTEKDYQVVFDGDDIAENGTVAMGGWSAASFGGWVIYDSSGGNEHTVISNWGGGATAGVLLRLEPNDDSVEAFVALVENNQI